VCVGEDYVCMGGGWGRSVSVCLLVNVYVYAEKTTRTHVSE
jgi:hypothetical protein